MRIVFLGDIVGRSGRDGVIQHIPALREKYNPDVLIVNGENAASGFGVTMKIAQEFFAAGVSCVTTGNHVWGQRELVLSIDKEPRLLRPLNFPSDTPGKGFYVHALPDGRKILIVNLIGRLFMDTLADDPFAAAAQLFSTYKLGQNVHAAFVDFHAEATSEKVSMGHVLDGRVSAVVGTHTHVPTADVRVLPKGTAYQTDAGMCGDPNSVIGVKVENATWRFLHRYPGERLIPAEGSAMICGTFVETDDKTGLAQKAQLIRMGA